MPTKVLSGVLITRDHYGARARINLDDNSLVEAPVGVRIDGHVVIGSGRYLHVPCTMVALREVNIRITHPHGVDERDRVENDRFRRNTVFLDEHYMEIEWEARGGSKIEEISYMVIGEVLSAHHAG
jgi:hypothetical protein